MTAKMIADGWSEIVADPKHTEHARRIMVRNIGRYNKAAAEMTRYLGELVTLTCAPDMLKLRLFPNGKEVSESFGAYNAVRYKLQQFKLNDPNVSVIVVGDGRTPRTAATFAFRSAWMCHSVDPMLGGGSIRWAEINRLTIHKRRIEDCSFMADRVILVAVHSHANLSKAVQAVTARELAVVAMPCCVPQKLDGIEPDNEYEDGGVISPCRTIKVWNNVADMAHTVTMSKPCQI